MKKGQKKIHYLEKNSINIETRTANCSNCGKIRIYKSNKNGWRCSISSMNGKKNQYSFILPKKIIRFGKCEICKIQSRLYLDHCHKRNIFRGFLCLTCNTLLGFAYDNKNILKQSIKYLDKSY